MFKSILAIVAVSTFCVAGQAQYPAPRQPQGPQAAARADLKSLAQDVERLVSRHADVLERDERRYVKQALADVIRTFAMRGIYIDRQPAPRVTLICDSSNNQLIELGGRMIHDFGNPSDCNTAKAYVERGEFFCDSSGNTLYDFRGNLIYDFGNPSNCDEARQQIMNGQRFCDYSDNTLRESNGTLVYDFSNPAECKNAMR